MKNLITSKMTLVVLALTLAFSAGFGITVLAEEINTAWTGQQNLEDTDAIVNQLIITINDLDAELLVLQEDADGYEAEILALEAERDSAQAELLLANQAATALQILTLPIRYISDYDVWCVAPPVEPGDYTTGTYTATVYAINYTSYSDEDYTEVVIVVDDNGYISDVTFTAYLIGGGTKDDPYASWLNWDLQMEAVADAIIAAQGWEPEDDIDGVSGATISIDGFELAFTTAIADAIPE